MADPPQVEFALSEEQQMLRETTRRFLREQAPPSVVRRVIESESGFDDQLWKAASALGWPALAIPEQYGGAGFGFVELSIVLEEMGRTLFPGPYLSTVVMAANAILLGGTEEQKRRHLPQIASGEELLTMAIFETPHGSALEDISSEATKESDSWVLQGAKAHVPFGGVARTFLVTARTSQGVSLFVVPSDVPGVATEKTPSLDSTRPQANVTFEDVRLGPDSILSAEGKAAPVLESVLRLASVALALEQVGGAQWCLETSVEHARTRYQFGRAIGSFQAIKHRCADMLVAVEHAKSVAYHAARVTDDQAEISIAAPMAKSICSESYLRAAKDTIQILGGTGFTWEHDAHLYLKKAMSTSLMFGSPRQQRRDLAGVLGF